MHNTTAPIALLRRRLYAGSTAALVAVAGVTLAGCDAADTSTYGETTTSEGATEAAEGVFAGVSVSDIKSGINDIVSGDGSATEKLTQLLDNGQERFASFKANAEETGDSAMSDLFGNLTEQFDSLKGSVSGGNIAEAAKQFAGLQDLDIASAAMPYIEPYMEGIKSLIDQAGASGLGDAATGALNALGGGGSDSE
ncbi:MAG: hypothetical protein AAF561_09590 [Planctomycetota bacterium]